MMFDQAFSFDPARFTLDSDCDMNVLGGLREE